MTVTLVLTTHFRTMLGVDEVELELHPGATVADAVERFLDRNPHHRSTLEARKGFLFGKLKAIYSVDGHAVALGHVLRDGDRLMVLKAFIGG